jgi:hypothetical protein
VSGNARGDLQSVALALQRNLNMEWVTVTHRTRVKDAPVD